MSEPISDGGSAFPVPAYTHTNGDVEWPTPGMMQRDWFAGMALQAYLSNLSFGGELQRIFDPNKTIANAGDEREQPLNYVARLAYAMADAMIAERSKKL